mgnify:FL=1
MAGYVEKKKIKGKTYYYLTETARKDGKWKKTRKYLGVHTPHGFEKPRKENPKPQLTKKELSIIELIQQNYTRKHDIGPKLWEEEKERLISFIYNTNAIEGNTLTLKETADVLNGKKIKSKPRDVKEVHNMKECVDFIFKTNKEITQEFILNLHEMEMKGILGGAGKYRKVDVKVGNYICPPHEDIPSLMASFIVWYESMRTVLHPFELAALIHTRFVRIHPFRDGNGRMARLLMNYVLIRNNYPLVNIFNDEKMLYYLVLREIDAKKRFKPFTKYLYKVFINQYKEYAVI